jgi:hypothetical protein
MIKCLSSKCWCFEYVFYKERKSIKNHLKSLATHEEHLLTWEGFSLNLISFWHFLNRVQFHNFWLNFVWMRFCEIKFRFVWQFFCLSLRSTWMAGSVKEKESSRLSLPTSHWIDENVLADIRRRIESTKMIWSTFLLTLKVVLTRRKWSGRHSCRHSTLHKSSKMIWPTLEVAFYSRKFFQKKNLLVNIQSIIKS